MAIIENLVPTESILGPLNLRRVLPHAERQMVGPFTFMEQCGPVCIPSSTPGGVSEHPHYGLATLTYLLDGQLLHRDSAGHSGHVTAGDVALMTAGSGITHEELRNREEPGPMYPVYFAQFWIALPDSVEEMSPTFELNRLETIPVHSTHDGDVLILMGNGWGKTSPTTTYSETILFDLSINPGGSMLVDCKYDEVAIFLLEGDAFLNDERILPHVLTVLDSSVSLTVSSNQGCRALLLGGDTFASPRIMSGGFVASSNEKMRRIIQKYQAGNFPSLEHGG